jgi:hypothetical protein
MAYTLNGLQILELDLSVPLVGPLNAYVFVTLDTGSGAGLVQATPVVGDAVSLVVDALTIAVTIISVDPRALNRAAIVVVGGAGGLPSYALAQNYSGNPTVQTVLQRMCAASGEVLSTSLSDQGVLSTSLNSWQVLSTRTWAQNLSALTRKLGCSWRVDPTTGAIYVKQDAFTSAPTMPTNPTLDSVNYTVGATYEAPALDMLPMPGTQDSNGAPINEVRVIVHDGMLQFQLLGQQLSSYFVQPIDVALTRNYPATVVIAQGSGYNLQPDDPSIAGTGTNGQLLGVPYRGGASATWTLLPGCRVLLQFDNGDPSLPNIIAFDGWNTGDFLTTVAYGNPAAAHPVALSNVVDANFSNVSSAATAGMNAAAPNDGGKAAFTAFISALSALPTASKRLLSD